MMFGWHPKVINASHSLSKSAADLNDFWTASIFLGATVSVLLLLLLVIFAMERRKSPLTTLILFPFCDLKWIDSHVTFRTTNLFVCSGSLRSKVTRGGNKLSISGLFFASSCCCCCFVVLLLWILLLLLSKIAVVARGGGRRAACSSVAFIDDDDDGCWDNLNDSAGSKQPAGNGGRRRARPCDISAGRLGHQLLRRRSSAAAASSTSSRLLRCCTSSWTTELRRSLLIRPPTRLWCDEENVLWRRRRRRRAPSCSV